MIPYSTQDITEDDVKAVVETLKSDLITQGPKNIEFENLMKERCNVKFAFSTNSASSALHLACLSLDLSKDDLVWTTPISFAATTNCAIHCGAKIDFVDIDLVTYNISVSSLEEKLIEAEKNGCLPKIVIIVHLAGQPGDLKEIYDLSIKYNFKIIEDASHAVGAKYKNSIIGDCKYSDITVFSFHPVKIMTTAEGGMILTKNEELAKKVELMRTNGITKNHNQFINQSDGPWYYEQQLVGFNFRLNDVQAALGCSQLKRVDKNIETRYEIASRYKEEFNTYPIITPKILEDRKSSYHLYIIRILEKDLKENRSSSFKHLVDQGIGVNLHYIPIYKHPFYKRLGFDNYELPNAEEYYSSAYSIPMFPSLNLEQQNKVIDEIKRCLQ